MSNTAEKIQTAITTIVELYADKFQSFSFSVNLYVDKLAVQILCFKSCAGLTFYADNSVSPTSFTLAAKPNSYILQIMENCANSVEAKIADHAAKLAAAAPIEDITWSLKQDYNINGPSVYQAKYFNVPISVTDAEGSPTYAQGLTSSKLWDPFKHKSTPKKFTSLTAMYTPPKAHKEKPKSAWQMKQEAEQAAEQAKHATAGYTGITFHSDGGIITKVTTNEDAWSSAQAKGYKAAIKFSENEEFYKLSATLAAKKAHFLSILNEPNPFWNTFTWLKNLNPTQIQENLIYAPSEPTAPAEPLADPSGPAPLKSLQLEMCDFVQQNEPE